ncbi:YopX family protein [Bacillus licheniformis]|uniref:YopX family protein n=1 Tax=Bacillus licheniformis TaxID=1402 RepID=UPI000BA5C873|nr:YopX family protein [Bacillus licheniformis]PAE70585.1 hypothetical protein CHH84_19885 [Bacillus licheniformis]
MTHLHYRVWDGRRMHYWDDKGLSLEIKGNVWTLWRDISGEKFIVSESYEKDSALMWGTGEKAKDGREIYDRDALNVFKGYRSFKSIVKFGYYQQDGSGGEYSPKECIGFYAEAIQNNQKDEFGCRLIYDFDEETSLLVFDSIEIIGNVYENPDLLEAAE